MFQSSIYTWMLLAVLISTPTATTCRGPQQRLSSWRLHFIVVKTQSLLPVSLAFPGPSSSGQGHMAVRDLDRANESGLATRHLQIAADLPQLRLHLLQAGPRVGLDGQHSLQEMLQCCRLHRLGHLDRSSCTGVALSFSPPDLHTRT